MSYIGMKPWMRCASPHNQLAFGGHVAITERIGYDISIDRYVAFCAFCGIEMMADGEGQPWEPRYPYIIAEELDISELIDAT